MSSLQEAIDVDAEVEIIEIDEIIEESNRIIEIDDEDESSEHDVNNSLQTRRYMATVLGDPTPKPSPRFHAILKIPKTRKVGLPFIRTWTQNPAKHDMELFGAKVKQQIEYKFRQCTAPPFSTLCSQTVLWE